MVTETTVLETDAVYSEDMKKRYELTKRFKGMKGKSILVIMINPSAQDIRKTDTTTNLLLNHLCRDGEMGYTTITIWNLFANLCVKLKPSQIKGNEDNMEYLDKLLERDFDTYLIGWGNTYDGNKIILREKWRLSKKLNGLKDKLVNITDPEGELLCPPMHPLFASEIREWKLTPYQFPEMEIPEGEEEEITTKGGEEQSHENKRERAIKKMKRRLRSLRREEETESSKVLLSIFLLIS